MLTMARRAASETCADAVLLLAEWPLDWKAVRKALGKCKLLAASVPGTDSSAALGKGETDHIPGDSLEDAKTHWIRLEESAHPTLELLSMALLEAVADEYLSRGDVVVALYSGFDADEIDSLSVIRLGEHLERLTAADLQKLETQVPLETLQAVVHLALEIGYEGREGHPVGTMFVVGDTNKVMNQCRPMGYDPVKGYRMKERNLRDRRNRESIKEIAKLDGAMIVDRDGGVRAAAQRIGAPAAGITLSKGLGTRHWAAAEVTKVTKAIAVVVSQSSGTVRIFQNGRVVLLIPPLRRPMKWQGFEPDSSAYPE